jgi:RimJ/RimL family protein N-acetyltransferase
MVKLRQVTEKDCRLIWNWANDPQVRAGSFSTDSIPYENHRQWFESKLNDPSCFFFIAENRNGEPVGQVRFDFEGKEATISINLDREFRDKGYGSKLIQLAAKKISDVSEVDKIHAYIKKENTASLKSFQKAGFQDLKVAKVDNQQAFHLILTMKS